MVKEKMGEVKEKMDQLRHARALFLIYWYYYIDFNKTFLTITYKTTKRGHN